MLVNRIYVVYMGGGAALLFFVFSLYDNKDS